MTGSALLLEEFASTSVAPVADGGGVRAEAEGAAERERVRAAAWEQGYKAGWDDALRSEAQDQNRITAAFARSLQEMTFTYHEARMELIESLEPLVLELVMALFPPLLGDSVAAAVLESVGEMIESGGPAGGLEIVCSPAGCRQLETRLQGRLPADVSFVSEPALADCQVLVRVGNRESLVDVGAARERVVAAVSAYFDLVREEKRAHG